jgi:uncharacterized membrane protein YqiK
VAIFLFAAVFFISIALILFSFRAPGPLKPAALIFGLILLILSPILASVVYVGANSVGLVTKNAFGGTLKDGQIIATNGEMGVQSQVLSPGWHFGYFPFIFTVENVRLTEVSGDEVGLIEARDGKPLPTGQLFAPEFAPAEFQKMLDAEHFLTAGNGYKGKQSSVLTPGLYRINTELFKITRAKQTEVKAGEVAVIKANYGKQPTKRVMLPAPPPLRPGDKPGEPEEVLMAAPGEMGIRAEVLPPGKYPLNTEANTVIEIWTTEMVAHYTMGGAGNTVTKPSGEAGHLPQLEEREITVRTVDGFTFPVDVRVSYKIEAQNAPIVVARFGDDEGERFRNTLNSAVRASFRNAAEGVRAMDYVQQRSMQESQSMTNIARHMKELGVTITGVNIGNVGDEKTLGALLKTQTDREIAKQEQLTFSEQQKAAEKKKELSRATQESEEEKKLATAAYGVKIAEEENRRKIMEAKTAGESITIKAKAQADAYMLIAQQIGKSNAALVELLNIIGEKQIPITPRVMISGNNGSSGGISSALMGTMLDMAVSRDEDGNPSPSTSPAKPRPAQPGTTPGEPAKPAPTAGSTPNR